MSDSLCQQIVTLFQTELNLLIPSVETDLIDEGLIDSLVFVDLIMKLESTYMIEIPVAELDIDQFRTVARMADFIAALQETPPVAQESAA
jgi:acyl carrier protein